MLILLSQHLAWPGAPMGCGFPCPLGPLPPVTPCGLADSVLFLMPYGLLILVPAPQGDGSLYCSWCLRSAPGRMVLHGTLCSERGWEKMGALCPAVPGCCRLQTLPFPSHLALAQATQQPGCSRTLSHPRWPLLHRRSQGWGGMFPGQGCTAQQAQPQQPAGLPMLPVGMGMAEPAS